MNVLYETDKLLIGNEFEVAFLIDKKTGREILKEKFYGDPTCGLISKSSDWALIAGEKLIFWSSGKQITIEDNDLKWIHAIRNKDNHTIELLVDPWNENSSIWELNTITLEYKKSRNFNYYRDKEFTEDVSW